MVPTGGKKPRKNSEFVMLDTLHPERFDVSLWHTTCVSLRARAPLHGCPTDPEKPGLNEAREFKTLLGDTQMKKQQGFTLIELMIVVAIIAILAAIAISQYQDYVIRSQVSEGSALADGVKTAMAEYRQTTGFWPADNPQAGLTPRFRSRATT